MLKWPAYVIVTSPESESAPAAQRHQPRQPGRGRTFIVIATVWRGAGHCQSQSPLGPFRRIASESNVNEIIYFLIKPQG